MPGWIIQGVRGEGKSLCAVGKIRDYLIRGRPVATNLDLYLDNLLPEHNNTLVYRLPDHPRSQDLNALPPAYDPRYKAEDRNGLLVLDESIIWLNGRKFKDKDREKLLEWLILSRKDHWDLILICQDHEAIDKTARSSLCDYLVQASRSDRMKKSFILSIRNLFKFQTYSGNVHTYEVFYGFTFANPPTDTWEFTGLELYDSYDTNQRFRDGNEIMGNKLVDMRAMYTMLPASYLTKYHYKKPHNDALEVIENIEFKEPEEIDFDEIEEGISMAVKGKKSQQGLNKVKLVLLIVVGIGFLGYRIFTGEEEPRVLQNVKQQLPLVTKDKSLIVRQESKGLLPLANHRDEFISYLLENYRPRISTLVSSKINGIYGNIDFYEGTNIVERFSINQLHSLGVAVVIKPYGVDVVTSSKNYVVTSWALPKVIQQVVNNQGVKS